MSLMSLMSRGNNAPWAQLSWWIRVLYKSTYYYYYYCVLAFVSGPAWLQACPLYPWIFHRIMCFFSLFPAATSIGTEVVTTDLIQTTWQTIEGATYTLLLTNTADGSTQQAVVTNSQTNKHASTGLTPSQEFTIQPTVTETTSNEQNLCFLNYLLKRDVDCSYVRFEALIVDCSYLFRLKRKKKEKIITTMIGPTGAQIICSVHAPSQNKFRGS